jgi:iron-sulfur cluster assembly accessory protein
MITVTDSAANKIRSLLDAEGSEESGLRMAVTGGGCSGFQYKLEFAGAAGELDQIIEANGVKVFVDPKSSLYLSGATLNFDDGLMGSGFQVENPSARTTCGCGESFSF